MMEVGRIWTWLTVLIAGLVAVASAAGLVVASVYAKETSSWAAQGMGQDVVNLAVAVPVLLVSAAQAGRGSARALLVWMGTLLYTIYSYVLYALFVHFGMLFPVYVAVLGLSFYALLGATACVDLGAPVWHTINPTNRAVSLFLMSIGILFALLWLSDIAAALVAGRAPASVSESGFAVNPVHVLDLAFVCPGMILTGVLLRKRAVLGMLFAVPLMVFAAIMGIAIVAMMLAMRARGVVAPAGPAILIAAIATISVYLTCGFLKGMQEAVWTSPAPS